MVEFVEYLTMFGGTENSLRAKASYKGNKTL